MNLANLRSQTLTLAAALLLAACSGGGGSGNPGGGANVAPVVDAGADRTVAENTLVTLSVVATDANGDVLTFQWTQTGGSPVVSLADADTATADFMAPDVAANAPAILTFRVVVSDGTVSSQDTVTITVQEPQPAVTVSGILRYEFVPPNYVGAPNDCRGLDFNNIQLRPIRGATVQLLDAVGGVLQSTTASDSGAYSFSNVDANSDVSIRVRAELKQAGTPGWDVEVRDNFIAGASDFDAPPPPPLSTRALYTLDGAVFNTGAADVVRNLTATTGWSGASYTGARAAAPFAILDTIYSGIRFVLSADPNAVFPPLDAYWSVNNTLVSGSLDITAGDLTASFYRGDIDSLFLLGDANVDTEEFDDHVILHEWGHYFEDVFSRSDSIGGPHSIGESVDARLAFGEGWATAFAAMALDDPIYCDSGIAGLNSGFGLNAETDSFGINGWFNEFDVTTFIYDLWDTDPDGTDVNTIGFGPIYDTMTGPQRFTESWTTVHSFAAELRAMLAPPLQLFVDSQLADENIVNGASLDRWGDNETNDANSGRDVLPIYTDITADGSTTNICTNSDFDSDRGGNKLAEYRFLRIDVPVTDTYDVVITTTTATPVTPDPNDRDQSDPDMQIYRNGSPVLPFPTGLSPDANSETFTTPLLIAGESYIADLHEWRFEDFEAAPPSFPEQICFDVTFTATP